jgi:DNA-binding SARP family transcriptional activator
VITCCTLGPASVLVDGAPAPPELLWRKHLALLIYLARSPRRGRSREHLVGLLWPDKPETAARHSLREAVHVLRRTAGEARVLVENEQVRLAEGAVELDVDLLVALAAQENWSEAAALAHGEFLEGLAVPDAPAFDDWLAAERALWRNRSVDVRVRFAEELTRAGRAREGAVQARLALALDPLSEAAAAAAVRSLALEGERAVALETFQSFAARVTAEIGAKPGAALQGLAERVAGERAGPPAQRAHAEPGAEGRRAPLIGREQTLGAVVAAWGECLASRRAALAWVDGDPGTGRTRLADEVVARARLDGAATAVARAVPADRDQPWSGVTGLARGGLLSAAGVAAAAPGALAAFGAVLPEWADRFPSVRRVPPVSPGAALTEIARAAAEERPLMLVLDDAQWSDRETLLALDAALRDLAGAPVFTLLTSSRYPPREELEQLGERAGRDVPGTAVRLAPLDLDGLRSLAAWAMPRYGPAERDRLARRIAVDSAGLPLLAVELLHAVALGLDVHATETASAWPEEHRTLDQTLPGDLPDNVTAALRVGFRRLSRDAQAVLAAASVLGDRVPGVILGRATGLAGERLSGALDELEWLRWLAAESRGYAFVARVVRDVVARDMLTEGQRQRVLEAAGLKAAPGAG